MKLIAFYNFPEQLLTIQKKINTNKIKDFSIIKKNIAMILLVLPKHSNENNYA